MKNSSAVDLCAAFIVGWLVPEVVSSDILAAAPDRAVQLSRQYLESDDSGKKENLAKELSASDADWEQVVERLRTHQHEAVKPGYYPEEHFSDPALRKSRPDDLLYFMVPTSYRADKPSALVVFMHGGGKGSPRTSPARYMKPSDDKTPTSVPYIGGIFEDTGMIGVAPSAPWNPEDHGRWNMKQTDAYMVDVILECKRRFNIDPNRVILVGHSMGGFGTYQLAQRQPDRYAAIFASAGSWTLAQWPTVRGTTFAIVHGKMDAEHGVRARHTDFAFARYADQLLTEQGIPHFFLQHPGGHPMGFARPVIRDFLLAHPDLRRDPYFPHIALASPVGFRDERSFPLRHKRWLTLDKSRDGELEFDALKGSGKGSGEKEPIEDWNSWRLSHQKVKRKAAMIEAINQGGNLIEVTTTNVSRFTLWLHPEMIDFSKKVRVKVNGELLLEKRIVPSLTTALQSFERRQDWGLIYPAKITLNVRD